MKSTYTTDTNEFKPSAGFNAFAFAVSTIRGGEMYNCSVLGRFFRMSSMICRGLFMFGIALTLLTGCAVVGGEAQVDSALTGTWLPIKAERDGKPFNFVKDFKLEVTGDRFMTAGGTQVDVGRLIFFDGEPRGIDVIGEDGSNKGQRVQAIYRFLGDRLEICYDLSGKERPREFATKPNTQLFLISYKRKP